MCFQDDIVMGTLSVRENLLFSANLRLNPQHHSTTDKNIRVNNIIQDLGLADCADTKVQCYIHNLHITHYTEVLKRVLQGLTQTFIYTL